MGEQVTGSHVGKADLEAVRDVLAQVSGDPDAEIEVVFDLLPDDRPGERFARIVFVDTHDGGRRREITLTEGPIDSETRGSLAAHAGEVGTNMSFGADDRAVVLMTALVGRVGGVLEDDRDGFVVEIAKVDAVSTPRPGRLP